MSFTGTTEKCRACENTVHFIEMISADGIPYHKNCFRCSKCNGKLSISLFSAVEGKLYCKPHFEQLLKRKGSFTSRSLSGRLNPDMPKTPSKAASSFSGTVDKCSVCSQVVYPLEKVTVEGLFYHKSCFRCYHGGCKISASSYAALDGFLYCKPHYTQLFKEKGSYNHLTKTASLKKMEAAALAEQAIAMAEEAAAMAEQAVAITKEAETTKTSESEPDEEPGSGLDKTSDKRDELGSGLDKTSDKRDLDNTNDK